MQTILLEYCTGTVVLRCSTFLKSVLSLEYCKVNGTNESFYKYQKTIPVLRGLKLKRTSGAYPVADLFCQVVPTHTGTYTGTVQVMACHTAVATLQGTGTVQVLYQYRYVPVSMSTAQVFD